MMQKMKTWKRVLPVTDINVEMVDVAYQRYFGVFDVKMEEELRQLKEDNQHLHTEASEAKQ